MAILEVMSNGKVVRALHGAPEELKRLASYWRVFLKEHEGVLPKEDEQRKLMFAEWLCISTKKFEPVVTYQWSDETDTGLRIK